MGRPACPLWAKRRSDERILRQFVDRFATLRMQLRKFCTTGLTVRFFNVTIPTGHGRMVRFTGKTLSANRSAWNWSTELNLRRDKAVGSKQHHSLMNGTRPNTELWNQQTMRPKSLCQKRYEDALAR